VGTGSLVGGDGTTVAWASLFAAEHGVGNVLEMGIAAATFDLILASARGGPIAQHLIRRHLIDGLLRCSETNVARHIFPAQATNLEEEHVSQ